MAKYLHDLRPYTYCRTSSTDPTVVLYPPPYRTVWDVDGLSSLRKCTGFHTTELDLGGGKLLKVVLGLKQLGSSYDMYVGAITALIMKDGKLSVDITAESTVTGIAEMPVRTHATHKSRVMENLVAPTGSLPEDHHMVLKVLAGWTNTIQELGIGLTDTFEEPIWRGIFQSPVFTGDMLLKACLENPISPLGRETALSHIGPGLTFVEDEVLNQLYKVVGKEPDVPVPAIVMEHNDPTPPDPEESDPSLVVGFRQPVLSDMISDIKSETLRAEISACIQALGGPDTVTSNYWINVKPRLSAKDYQEVFLSIHAYGKTRGLSGAMPQINSLVLESGQGYASLVKLAANYVRIQATFHIGEVDPGPGQEWRCLWGISKDHLGGSTVPLGHRPQPRG